MDCRMLMDGNKDKTNIREAREVNAERGLWHFLIYQALRSDIRTECVALP